LGRGLRFWRVTRFLMEEDAVANIVWLLIVLFLLSWWNGR
jgi:hypothetical protein